MMGRFRIPAVVVFLAIALGGCAAGGSSPEPRNAAARTEATQAEATRGGAPEKCKYAAIVEHAFSGSDDTDLVGFADNVFVGRVKERVGSTGGVTPARLYGGTRFSVEVLENVKGGLGGTVTVSQEGFFDAERGCLMLAEDDPLLEPGQEVVFFTRHDEERGWQQIVTPGYGDVRVEGEGHREELVRRFERARKNQTDPLR
jgi:hypothetical protein